jgi:hypothetical protein
MKQRPSFTVAYSQADDKVARLHSCGEMPTTYSLRDKRDLKCDWSLYCITSSPDEDDMREEIVAFDLSFCPYCGIELPYLHFEIYEHTKI